MVDLRPRQDEVWLVTLDPSVGAEIRKTRPCLVVSPNEINAHLATVIIAPMTTSIRSYPSRVTAVFQDKTGQIALDQPRTVDRVRLVHRLGRLDRQCLAHVADRLARMFARPDLAQL